jgi:hypothetical protein
VGGNGGGASPYNPGTVNTGGGGSAGNTGGSGVVIFSIPLSQEPLVTFSAGVTHTSNVAGLNRVYTVTATSTTSETVTIL